MAFFDELSKKASNIAASTQKTANVVKLQHQISQKQSEFDSLYHQIGQIYYSCRQRGVQPDESITGLCDRVTALCQEIEALRAEIDRIRNVRRCAACGKVIDRSVKFCPNCGEKVVEEAPKAEEEAEKKAEEAPKAEEAVEVVTETAEETGDSKVYINWPKAEEKAGEEVEEKAGEQPDEQVEEQADDECACGCACSCCAEEAPETEKTEDEKAE